MFLDNKTFASVIDSTPLVSIDLVIKNNKDQVLLGLRKNKPANNCWFVPGGRILKNESMKTAFKRICRSELGFDYSIDNAEFIGPFEHFYNNCVFSEHISTHYVVLAYEIVVDEKDLNLPSQQHSEFKWFNIHTLQKQKNVHKHTKWYFDF